jgi:ribosomal protein L11 methyltransferase
MPWLCAIVDVEERHVEALSDALMALGALAVDVQDAAAGTATESPIFAEPGEPPVSAWPDSRVGALFTLDVDLYVVLPQAFGAAGLAPRHDFRVERVEDTDWVRLTQSQFQPIAISPRLWIVPSWHAVPDPTAINIMLDPGVAFGTGAHPTTRLCLQWLETVVHPDTTVLDYGCGSGILAIAALKLGAKHASGVDIDPQAVQAAKDNAQYNQVVAEFNTAVTVARSAVDIVVANILANPLVVLAPLLAQQARTGGLIALSGILIEQAEMVIEAYTPDFEMTMAARDEGWVLLTGVRR